MGAGAQADGDGAGCPHYLFRHEHAVRGDDLAAVLCVFSQFMNSNAVDVPHHEIEEPHPFWTVLLRKVDLPIGWSQTTEKHVMLPEVYPQLSPHLPVIGCH